MANPRAADTLDRACERIWAEIRSLLLRHRWLAARDRLRTPEQDRELRRVEERLRVLRSRSVRYRDVLREEAWSRALERAKEDPRA